MLTVHPQYITDTAGQQLVVLPVAEFNSIMEELEDVEDVRIYDEAKKNDTGERIPMEEAFKIIEAKRGKGK
jgi:PHD/YefM family antitoxin component YafN of YafNO toxin-antitoxin module